MRKKQNKKTVSLYNVARKKSVLNESPSILGALIGDVGQSGENWSDTNTTSNNVPI
jgi:hypothetical protein